MPRISCFRPAVSNPSWGKQLVGMSIIISLHYQDEDKNERFSRDALSGPESKHDSSHTEDKTINDCFLHSHPINPGLDSWMGKIPEKGSTFAMIKTEEGEPKPTTRPLAITNNGSLELGLQGSFCILSLCNLPRCLSISKCV